MFWLSGRSQSPFFHNSGLHSDICRATSAFFRRRPHLLSDQGTLPVVVGGKSLLSHNCNGLPVLCNHQGLSPGSMGSGCRSPGRRVKPARFDSLISRRGIKAQATMPETPKFKRRRLRPASRQLPDVDRGQCPPYLEVHHPRRLSTPAWHRSEVRQVDAECEGPIGRKATQCSPGGTVFFQALASVFVESTRDLLDP